MLEARMADALMTEAQLARGAENGESAECGHFLLLKLTVFTGRPSVRRVWILSHGRLPVHCLHLE
jgi:hypothetical protein